MLCSEPSSFDRFGVLSQDTSKIIETCRVFYAASDTAWQFTTLELVLATPLITRPSMS